MRKAFCTILIVDADEAARHELASRLASAERVSLKVAGPATALTTLALYPIDAVLLGLDAAMADDQALLPRLRRNWLGPIIAISATTDVLAKIRALDAGADDYVARTMAECEILARIRAKLRAHNGFPLGNMAAAGSRR
jgi:DNA-binding response OmpR family regulator